MATNNTTGGTARAVLLCVIVLLSAVAAVPLSGGVHADEQNTVFESFDAEFASADPEAPSDLTVQWELAADNRDIDEIRITVTNESDEPITLYKPGDTNVPNPFTVSTDDAGTNSADIVVENLTAATLDLKVPAGHCARVDAVRASVDGQGNETTGGPDVLREASCNSDAEAGAFAVTIDGYDENVTAGEHVNVTAEIENTGDIEASQDIRFLANGTAVDARENLTLSGNRSETVSFSYETGEKDAPAVEIAVESDDDTANRTVGVSRPESPFFAVAIENAPSKVTAGEPIEVVVRVENTGGDNGTQNVTLADLDSEIVDSSPPIGLAPNGSTNVSLNWSTERADTGVGNVTVRSENDTDTAEIDIRPVTVESITATLNETDLTEGEDTFVTVEATFTNGSALDVTDSTTLESRNTTVATVAANGTVLAETNGTAEIEATFGNETDSDVLSVRTLKPEEDGSRNDDSSSGEDSSNGGDDESNSERDGSGSENSGGSNTGGDGSDFDNGNANDWGGSGDTGSESGSNNESDTDINIDTDTDDPGSGSDGSSPNGDDSESENDGDDSDAGSDGVGGESDPEHDGSGSGSAQDGSDASDGSTSSVIVSPVVGWPFVLLPLLMARGWSLGR